MNKLLLESFTPQILRGALRCGLEWSDLQAMRLAPEQFEKLLGSIRRLTERQAVGLEKYTGKTIGQLAVLGIAAETNGPKSDRDVSLLADTVELMSIFDGPPAGG